VDPFLYITAREEKFDKTVSLNVQVMNLERSGKTALYHKDKYNGLEHQDWNRGPRNHSSLLADANRTRMTKTYCVYTVLKYS